MQRDRRLMHEELKHEYQSRKFVPPDIIKEDDHDLIKMLNNQSRVDTPFEHIPEGAEPYPNLDPAKVANNIVRSLTQVDLEALARGRQPTISPLQMRVILRQSYKDLPKTREQILANIEKIYAIRHGIELTDRELMPPPPSKGHKKDEEMDEDKVKPPPPYDPEEAYARAVRYKRAPKTRQEIEHNISTIYAARKTNLTPEELIQLNEPLQQ